MKITRFKGRLTGKESSKRAEVIILSETVTEEEAEGLRERYPNALRIAEVHKGMPAREGFFSILRLHVDELVKFDYDLKGCKAMVIEGVTGLFYPQAVAFCAEVAAKAKLDSTRIRLCCSFLSEPGGCNFSCYTAAVLRDYAAEEGITGIFPTAKSEVLIGDDLCLCVKI